MGKDEERIGKIAIIKPSKELIALTVEEIFKSDVLKLETEREVLPIVEEDFGKGRIVDYVLGSTKSVTFEIIKRR